MKVERVYVEKKSEFAVAARGLYSSLKSALRIDRLKGVRILERYDVEGVSEDMFLSAVANVISEAEIDMVYRELPEMTADETVFAVEDLPGQYDQRADTCAECIQFLARGERCRVKTARIYILSGKLNEEDLKAVKAYIINPLESTEASLEEVDSLVVKQPPPDSVETVKGFIGMNDEELARVAAEYGLAMDFDDVKFCRDYFGKTENRDPTVTEIRMIDTYWSDHCRHTTFLTVIDHADITPDYIKKSYEEYLNVRKELGCEAKPVTLMDIATIAAKKLKADGVLKGLDESEEVNACSVNIKADIDGKPQDWLLMFKNETHNHPTEMEPFGGASTCLGGAIRDPLSGRAYVYQAMRITGAANPLVPFADTIQGKLPQKQITVSAANGYSSYGNQIGLAAGLCAEIYHSGYAAKRMELGAVIAAAPKENVVRENPASGDLIILLGGKTGRDGCGGATGSSKAHTEASLETSGAEVQKGNPLIERNIQRLFRNPEVSKIIKRCNDFGAGGVSVAIGELADGLLIDLNAVPVKYGGLNGTELAISESQERMAVVVSHKNAAWFIEEALKENLEATVVAEVTAERRLVMKWNKETIVDLSRDFLNSNGAQKHIRVAVPDPVTSRIKNYTDRVDSWELMMMNLNVCSQKGLASMFDSTVGAGSVLMPFGGAWQLTPAQVMAAKIPVEKGETDTCSLMGWGYNPYISEKSPYHGAMLAVIESLAKVAASGGDYKNCYLTFQEYFERLHDNPARWGKPFAALLGAFKAQTELGCASIGGKDSMSGTFENIDVPAALVSFAVTTASAKRVISPEFKRAGNKVVFISPDYDDDNLPVFESIKSCFERVQKLIEDGTAISVWAVGFGGVAEALAKMSMGNRIGFKFEKKLSEDILFYSKYGAFIAELDGDPFTVENVIGVTIDEYKIYCKDYTVDMAYIQSRWEERLEPVFPVKVKEENNGYGNGDEEEEDVKAETFTYAKGQITQHSSHFGKPRVFIPIFPGTNSETEAARAFERCGAVAETFVITNITPALLNDAIKKVEKAIMNSQIICLPGGFSIGGSPADSARYMAAFFKHPLIADAVTALLEERGGMILGINSGFKALLKLGLLPFGKYAETTEASPILTLNTIGRHQSGMVRTRIASNKSPWLSRCRIGDVHTVALSSDSGRFAASEELVRSLAADGQIASQYVDLYGEPSIDIRYNPCGAAYAIEGLTSPDGRVFGKTAHSERFGESICKNVPGDKEQGIFESGVDYFI